MKLSAELLEHLKDLFPTNTAGRDRLTKKIERELAKLLESEDNGMKLLRRILEAQKDTNTKLNTIMITQEALNASAGRLETAAAAILAKVGHTDPSTPDNIVQAFQGRVDAVSTSLEAGAATPTPPPTP